MFDSLYESTDYCAYICSQRGIAKHCSSLYADLLSDPLLRHQYFVSKLCVCQTFVEYICYVTPVTTQ